MRTKIDTQQENQSWRWTVYYFRALLDPPLLEAFFLAALSAWRVLCFSKDGILSFFLSLTSAST
jgi:hypothetical protein